MKGSHGSFISETIQKLCYLSSGSTSCCQNREWPQMTCIVEIVKWSSFFVVGGVRLLPNKALHRNTEIVELAPAVGWCLLGQCWWVEQLVPCRHPSALPSLAMPTDCAFDYPKISLQTILSQGLIFSYHSHRGGNGLPQTPCHLYSRERVCVGAFKALIDPLHFDVFSKACGTIDVTQANWEKTFFCETVGGVRCCVGSIIGRIIIERNHVRNHDSFSAACHSWLSRQISLNIIRRRISINRMMRHLMHGDYLARN